MEEDEIGQHEGENCDGGQDNPGENDVFDGGSEVLDGEEGDGGDECEGVEESGEDHGEKNGVVLGADAVVDPHAVVVEVVDAAVTDPAVACTGTDKGVADGAKY